MYNLLFPLFYLVTKLISFGPKNDAELSRLSIGFGTDAQMFLLMVKVLLGYDVVVVDGLRTAAEQLALHKQNPKNPASPGDHGDGNALDLNFWKNGKPVLLKATSAAKWAPVYAIADIFNIDNGSTFNGYADNNHFYKRKRK